MAKIRFSTAITEMRGSVGGAVYSRNRGGGYVRARTSPVNPSSSRQTDARTVFSSAVNYWTNTMQAGERQAWDIYAAAVPYTDVFGASRYYSGQQRFIQAACAAVNAGGSYADAAVAPVIMSEAEPVLSTGWVAEQGSAVAGSTLKLADIVAPSDALAGDKLLIHIGAPVTNATNYFKGPWRYAGASTFVSGANYPDATITDPYGRTCAVGMVMPVQWRVIKADNRLSPVSSVVTYLAAYSA